jgi:hypothetical protein
MSMGPILEPVVFPQQWKLIAEGSYHIDSSWIIEQGTDTDIVPLRAPAVFYFYRRASVRWLTRLSPFAAHRPHVGGTKWHMGKGSH